METNQKLSDLSIGDLVSLFNYIDEDLDLLDNCIEASDKIEQVRVELIAVQEEIEKRRSRLFKH